MKSFHIINMSKDKEEKLTVAQMAEILGVNKTTLRYYNKKGITPSERDENNYRYYSKNQIKNFMIIKNFRTVGLSIEEIKEIREKVILNNYRDVAKLLEEKVKKYDEELEKIKEKKEALEKCAKYINVIAEILEVEPDYIYFENNTFKQREKMIFKIKEVEGKSYAFLFSIEKFTDLKAINTIYQKIEEEGYEIDGDLSIDIINPYYELNGSFVKIKIYRVPIKNS